MIYGYARVSTAGQARDGNSLADQEAMLLGAGCEAVVKEHYTGTKIDRPGFTGLLEKLEAGDRLVVTKLDRFARTAGDGIKAIEGLLSRGISVHILNMGLIDNTPTGRLMVTMLLAFAQFERDMIIERTAAGKAMAKAANPEWREGRKRIEVDREEFERCYRMHDEEGVPVSECWKALGVGETKWRSLCREYGKPRFTRRVAHRDSSLDEP